MLIKRLSQINFDEYKLRNMVDYEQKQDYIKFKSVSPLSNKKKCNNTATSTNPNTSNTSALQVCSLLYKQEQCTLPLCQQCLQIHEEEHRQKSQEPIIIPYRQAYEEVFGNLSLFIQNHKRPIQTLADQVKKDKQQAVKLVENYYKEVEAKIDQQTRVLSEVEQKFQKLKKGSIKTVIYYYSGQITLNPLQLPHFNPIQSSLKSFLKTLHQDKKEEIQTFRQKRNCQPEWSESKIQPYQPKQQQTRSRKKSIFQNDKSKVNLHRNNNEPYLENVVVVEHEKKEEERRNPYENYQREGNNNRGQNRGEQKSQVENYFHNYRGESSNKAGETNTHNGQMKSFKIQSKTLRNFEIESHLGIQPVENSYRPLKETPYVMNQQYRETRSRTLDKFPSMVDLKKGNRDNIGRLNQNEEEFTRFDKQQGWEDNRTGKWNKNHQQKENNRNYDQPASVFSQLTINQTTNNMSTTQFTNRRPLKTTDLDTYTPFNNNHPTFEGRQRAASHEGNGLRTTMSHNNLYTAGKKTQPLLGDELKKQVLSPHEIRRMLEKKIEERNKVLTQKKELQLKINPDRQGMAMGSVTRVATEVGYIKDKGQQQVRYDENTNVNWGQQEQKPSMYNTKDSIINHIYRETRY